MRRFTFFLGVLSTGLLVFLLLTGQLGKLFRAGETRSEPEVIDTTPIAPEEENRIRYHNLDYTNMRVRFSIEGYLDSGTKMSARPEVHAQRSLRDAVITFPFDGVDAAGDEEGTSEGEDDAGLSEFVLRAGLAKFEGTEDKPSGDGELLLFRAQDGIVGEGDDGTRIVTDSVAIEYDSDGEEMRFRGEEAIEARFPGLELYGPNGFTATVTAKDGLEHLEVAPPVMLAIERDRGGSLLDLGEPGKDEDDSRVFVASEAPLVIDRGKHRASFPGLVTIFRAPASTPLDPPPSPAETRFVCEGLDLGIDPNALTFVSAQAVRGKEPVRFHLEGGYLVTGDRLEWTEKKGEALLEGDVALTGRLGRMTAGLARLFPRESRGRLEGTVRSTLHARYWDGAVTDGGAGVEVAEEGASESPRARRRSEELRENDWKFRADEAEFEWYAGGEESTGRRLRSFSASSYTPGGLSLREVRDQGAELLGTTLRYDGVETVVVEGTQSPPFRPRFVDGLNSATAHRISLRLESRFLDFEGKVAANLVEPRLGPAERMPEWWHERRVRGEYAEFAGDKLRLHWRREGEGPPAQAAADSARGTPVPSAAGDPADEESRSEIELVELEAWGSQEPLRLRWVGHGGYELIGDHLTWHRGTTPEEPSRLTLDGTDRNQVLRQESAEVEARSITFDLDSLVLSAEGVPAELVFEKTLFSENASEKAASEMQPSDGGRVRVQGQRIQVTLVRRSRDSDEEVTTRDEDDRDAEESGETRLEVLHARAWTVTRGLVRVQDDNLSAEAGEFQWSAATRELRLVGGEPVPRILNLGEYGTDVLTADEIILHDADQSVRLRGNVRARIHQRNHGRSSRDTKEDQDQIWEVRAARTIARFTTVRSPDGRERQVLDEFEGHDGIEIGNEAEAIRFRGQSCEWNRTNQLMRIFSAQEAGTRQTLYIGRDGVSEVIAREVHLVRGSERGEDRLWVYLRGDVDCHVVLSEERTKSQENMPRAFKLEANDVLLELLPGRGQLAGALLGAEAWGDVEFSGGDYRVYSDRAVYQDRPTQLDFTCEGDKDVILVDRRGNSEPFRRLRLRRDDARFRIITRSTSPMSGYDLGKILDPIRRAERAKKK